ncbi:MAG: hypothetical protein LPD71_13955, partial [Shewanella sp.]|nr:hypothetical protein [Shewanella sp.]
MVKQLIAFMVFFVASPLVWAFNETGIALSDGLPVKAQNKETSAWDISLQHSLWTLGDDLAQVGLSARVGQLKLDDESGIRTGVGAFVSKNFRWVTLSIPIGVIWLEKTEFGADNLKTKNYGGNLQFTYGAEMAWNVSSH